MKAKSHLVHNSLKEVKITKLIPNLSSRLVFNIGMSGLFHDILFHLKCYMLYNYNKWKVCNYPNENYYNENHSS